MSFGAKAMASRSSSDPSVACGNDLTSFLRGGCEFSPSVAGFEIDRKDSIRVIAFERLQLQGDTRMSFGAAQFGKRVGIEKNSYIFTSRMGESSRVRFSLSKSGPLPIRNSLKSGRFPVSFS
jgi:hypothetical protein